MPRKKHEVRGDRIDKDESRAEPLQHLQGSENIHKGSSWIDRPYKDQPHTRAFTREQRILSEGQVASGQVRLQAATDQTPSRQTRSQTQRERVDVEASKSQKKTAPKKSGVGRSKGKASGPATKSHAWTRRIVSATTAQGQGHTSSDHRVPGRAKSQLNTHSVSNVTRVTPWLDSLPSDFVEYLDEEMASSTPIAATSLSFSHTVGTSTVNREKQRRKSEDEFLRQLQARNADPEENTLDELAHGLKKHFEPSKNIVIPFKAIAELVNTAKDFVARCEKSKANANSYTAIEDFRETFNNLLSNYPLFSVTNADFRKDLDHSQISNEAVFQRTVMLLAINRWQLDDIFDYDCEGLWVGHNHYLLPTTGGAYDTIQRKKPDLAIYFNLKAIRGPDLPKNVSVHPDLRPCVSPDNKTHRCFPFVFIEAKSNSNKLTGAIYDGMHSASQALYNIYVCMDRLQRSDIFFSEVRVFSIALNADLIVARIHRARISPQSGTIEFLFDQICRTHDYNRDQVSLLVRTMLKDYGLPKLFPILKEAFKDIVKMFAEEQKEEKLQKERALREMETSKRKAENAPRASNKRRGGRRSHPEPSIALDGSFGMSGLHTDGDQSLEGTGKSD